MDESDEEPECTERKGLAIRTGVHSPETSPCAQAVGVNDADGSRRRGLGASALPSDLPGTAMVHVQALRSKRGCLRGGDLRPDHFQKFRNYAVASAFICRAIAWV